MNGIMQLSSLNEALTTGMLAIKKITSDAKIGCIGNTGITPDSFIESIQFLGETIFKDAVDFYYEFTSDNAVQIKCGMKNMCMNEVFYVDCVLRADVNAEDLKKKFDEEVEELELVS